MNFKDLIAVHVLALLFVILTTLGWQHINSPHSRFVKDLTLGIMVIFIFDLSVVLWKLIDSLDER